MQPEITNTDIARISTIEFILPLALVSNQRVRLWSEKTRLLMSPSNFVGCELSLVPEVEAVYVESSESTKNFRILTVVDKRDPEVRAKVYARERAIIDEFSTFEFDFHIISRMGRDLRQVINETGKIAFKR